MSLMASAEPEQGATDWERVEQAVNFLSDLDIIEMATYVITQAQTKGPKEAFNEAGSVRYQLAKARQQYQFLKENICRNSLETQQQNIRALMLANERKRALTVPEDEDVEMS